jgi:hemoglobin
MRPTLYEYAGGDQAFLALATAHHARCLADPELNHPFSHGDLNPAHLERLAAYWAEVLGGPPRYTALPADQTSLLLLHAGNGDMTDLGRRFVECFVRAADDAGLPEDPEFRAVLAHEDRDAVPEGIPVPRWSWDGPAT